MPLLSICIPTFNRPLILKDVLESIFSQPVDTSLYEVCISDNAKTDENESMINTYFSKQPNLVYHRSSCEGFLNSVEALKLGTGTFLKLNNDTGKFCNNSLSKMIELLKKSEFDNNSVVFFLMSGDDKQEIFESFDSFLFNISYWSTWSSAFCIRKNQFEVLLENKISFDKMFPHTSLLFGLVSEKQFIVDSYKYIETVEAGKKGGYNLPETFGIRYIDMLDSLYSNHFLSRNTIKKIKKDIISFIAHWYVKTMTETDKYIYDFSKKEKYLLHSFGLKGLLYFYYFLFRERK